MGAIDHFIAGKAVSTSEGQSDLFNPSTGEKSGEVLMGGAPEIDTAVAAAKEAQEEWAKIGISHRAYIMLELRAQLVAHKDKLINMMVEEGGKTKDDATGEFMKTLEGAAFAASAPSWISTRHTLGVSTGIDTYELRTPVGVVAAICPFNFPIMIGMVQATISIVCGNAVIIKPSEKTPSAMRLIGELFKKAGLPDGIFNIVNGGRNAVDRIIAHPDIGGISFVGSTTVAEKVRIGGVTNGKKVQAFGSGKNHMIVMPDADLDMAADAAASAAYGASGQRCMAISVLVAVGSIADELVEKIKQRIPNIITGSSMNDDTELGPVISSESRDRIHGFLEEVESEGASLSVDGRLEKAGGFNVGACLVDNVQPGMRIYDEEVFGPVLSIVRVPTYEEAITVAQGHPMGNGAAIFTRDGGLVRRYLNEVQSGMAGVNVPIPVPIFAHSFGGWKGSAYSETKLTGADAVNFHTNVKTVVSRWPDPETSKVDLGFMTDR